MIPNTFNEELSEVVQSMEGGEKLNSGTLIDHSHQLLFSQQSPSMLDGVTHVFSVPPNTPVTNNAAAVAKTLPFAWVNGVGEVPEEEGEEDTLVESTVLDSLSTYDQEMASSKWESEKLMLQRRIAELTAELHLRRGPAAAFSPASDKKPPEESTMDPPSPLGETSEEMNYINGIITSNSSACSSPTTTIENLQKPPPPPPSTSQQLSAISSPVPATPTAFHSKAPVASQRMHTSASASASALVLDAASSAQVSMEAAIATNDPSKMREELLKQVMEICSRICIYSKINTCNIYGKIRNMTYHLLIHIVNPCDVRTVDETNGRNATK